MKVKPREVAGALVGMGGDLVAIALAIGVIVYDDDRVLLTRTETAAAAGRTFLYVHPRATNATLARGIVLMALTRFGMTSNVTASVAELLVRLSAGSGSGEEAQTKERARGPKSGHPVVGADVAR